MCLFMFIHSEGNIGIRISIVLESSTGVFINNVGNFEIKLDNHEMNLSSLNKPIQKEELTQ